VQKHPDKNWDWEMLCSNNMSLAREKYIQKNLFNGITKWFSKSDLKRELMENRWHPRNMDKWSGWGFELEC